MNVVLLLQRFALFGLCVLFLSTSAALSAREWTFDGQTKEATLLKIVDAAAANSGQKSVLLRRRDGIVIVVPVASLSQADQKFIADFESGATDNRGDKIGTGSGKIAAQAEKYAILIGVDKYPHLAPKSQLRFAGRDMALLAETFVANGFPKDNVFLATFGHISPTKERIEWQLQTLLPALKPEDSIVVAFCGHGVMLELDGVRRSYLCPSDTRTDVGSLDELAKILISRQFVDGALRDSPARSKVLICDACRTEDFKNAFQNAGGPGVRGGLQGNLRGKITSGTSGASEIPNARICVLSSCMPGQASKEILALGDGHGVFTWFLNEALLGYADLDSAGNNDGSVGVQEAFYYAQYKTQNFEMFDENGERIYQNPTFSGLIDGDFELTVRPDELPPLDSPETATH